MCVVTRSKLSEQERSLNLTWDVFGPADVDHQLPVGQVAQRGQSLDVALRYRGIRHGEDALRLGNQQQGDHFVLNHAASGD